ncbi:MAG: hypothetical protein RID09_17360 [Coleofasciculus sp. G1-WW12-02]|uniref:hypothetical protein n=1 Tax=unclassified Coleofasciculus TaxID=2692782 RepID=UPI0032FF8121
MAQLKWEISITSRNLSNGFGKEVLNPNKIYDTHLIGIIGIIGIFAVVGASRCIS